MTILMIACSRRAFGLMQRLKELWEGHEKNQRSKRGEVQQEIHFICKIKCSSLPDISDEKTLTECVGEGFEKRVDAIIFFCATGIAVRTIAPFLRHKSVDPAVLVIDETGKFCISLLSGHAGGANELAERIGSLLGAVPVITTATDREQKFAVDDFARKNGLVIMDWKLAKQVSAAILEGGRIAVSSDIAVEGILPPELFWQEWKEDGNSLCCENPRIWISYRRQECPAHSKVLQLLPRLIAVGIGCRRGTPEKKIAAAIEQCLRDEKIRFEAVFAIASIDLKQDEEGILSYCRDKGLPFLTFSSDTLRQLSGEFTDSPFVERTTGVSNVCERSAVAASSGSLICPKRVYDGVTVALAVRKGSVVI